MEGASVRASRLIMQRPGALRGGASEAGGTPAQMATLPDAGTPDRTLIESLMAHPERMPFPCDAMDLVETHISWVLLCGRDALKIKKPVHMGYIDFSTREQRAHCAREEIRLNGRLAPELYLGVIEITGSAAAPRFDGSGEPLESAVHMRQFDPAGQLDREIEAGRLDVADIEAVAQTIASFQAAAPRVDDRAPWGHFEGVMAPVRENFLRVVEVAADLPGLRSRLAALETISEQAGAVLRPLFRARREGGFIREGHGDLHLGNLARTRWGIRAFDALEFAPALRWLDVVSDLAFLHMDLIARGRPDLAWRLVNAWVERTGDHRGLRLLRFYTLYRTMVRVKVAALRRSQCPEGRERERYGAEIEHYLALAERTAQASRPLLVLMHGLSGSGKSHLAARLADQLGAVRLRSDVERKRLLADRDPARLYDAQAGERTYAQLGALASMLLEAGLPVVVDATCLNAAQRAPLCAIAAGLGVRAVIVACDAPRELLAERVANRLAEGSDPSDADSEVIARQIAEREWPAPSEADAVIAVDTSQTVDPERLAGEIGR